MPASNADLLRARCNHWGMRNDQWLDILEHGVTRRAVEFLRFVSTRVKVPIVFTDKDSKTIRIMWSALEVLINDANDSIVLSYTNEHRVETVSLVYDVEHIRKVIDEVFANQTFNKKKSF
jgi:predicted class III extradiol MEMO1 family dioxygenase